MLAAACLVSLHAVPMSVFSASPFLNQDNNKCMSVSTCACNKQYLINSESERSLLVSAT